MGTITYGGLENTVHWDEKTKKELGAALGSMLSGKPEERRKGYIKYHELKRKFSADEWMYYLRALNDYRKTIGHRSTDEIAEEIQREIEKNGYPLEAIPEVSPVSIQIMTLSVKVPFSNGNEVMLWEEANCDKCIKSWGNNKGAYKCEIEKEVNRSNVTGVVSEEIYAKMHPYCKDRVFYTDKPVQKRKIVIPKEQTSFLDTLFQ